MKAFNKKSPPDILIAWAAARLRFGVIADQLSRSTPDSNRTKALRRRAEALDRVAKLAEKILYDKKLGRIVRSRELKLALYTRECFTRLRQTGPLPRRRPAPKIPSNWQTIADGTRYERNAILNNSFLRSALQSRVPYLCQ